MPDFQKETAMIGKAANTIEVLVLAFALGLAGVPNAALADHCKGKHKNDPGCDGGGGGGTIAFSVAIVGDGTAPVGTSPEWIPTCTASTHSTPVNKIDGIAIFARHDLCATLTTSTGATLTDDIRVDTELSRAGEVLSVQVTGQDIIGETGIVHISDWLPLEPPVLPDAAGFTFHVHAIDVPLWRCDAHLLRKNTTCEEWVGNFTLDDMIFTPDP